MKNVLIYLDLESEVPPATSTCEIACAEFESNPWFIHENPADISRRKHSCIINRLLKNCLPFIVLYFALLAVGIPWFSLEEQAPVAQVVFTL